MTHTDLKDPPYSVIEVGYLLTTARNKWPEGGYLSEVIGKIEKAHDEVIAELETCTGPIGYRMDSHSAIYDLCEAAHAQTMINAGTANIDKYRKLQGKYAIGKAHRKLADMMLGYGYRLPTAREFAEVNRKRGGDGDGGGR